MTTTESAHVEDLPGTPGYRARSRPIPPGRDADDHGAHLLRLVLDLQLDALLLGLGAAAVQESRSNPSTAPATAAPSPPWPRWATEDIDLARTLATETVNNGAALPATLGPEPAAQEERVVFDRLAARYESMSQLLGDLLARTTPGAPAASRTRLRILMAHCHKRLAELRAVTGPATGCGSSDERAYLPGELLG